MGIAWFFIFFTVFCYILIEILLKYHLRLDEYQPQEKEDEDGFFYSAMYLSQND